MKQTVCVDLDGVLAKNDGWKGVDYFGGVIPGAIEFTKNLSEQFNVCIFTCRCNQESNNEYSIEELKEKVQKWLDSNGFYYDQIYTGMGKPIALAYIDDRSISCLPEVFNIEAFNSALQMLSVFSDSEYFKITDGVVES